MSVDEETRRLKRKEKREKRKEKRENEDQNRRFHQIRGVNEARINDRESNMGNITIQLALVSTDKHNACIVVVDQIRLATLTFVKPVNDIWYNDRLQGPCPITEIEKLKARYEQLHLPPRSQDSISN